jgi:hypothetical protein
MGENAIMTWYSENIPLLLETSHGASRRLLGSFRWSVRWFRLPASENENETLSK